MKSKLLIKPFSYSTKNKDKNIAKVKQLWVLVRYTNYFHKSFIHFYYSFYSLWLILAQTAPSWIQCRLLIHSSLYYKRLEIWIVNFGNLHSCVKWRYISRLIWSFSSFSSYFCCLVILFSLLEEQGKGNNPSLKNNALNISVCQ